MKFEGTESYVATEDLMVAHYFKRLTVIDALFGHTDLHLEAFVNAPA